MGSALYKQLEWLLQPPADYRAQVKALADVDNKGPLLRKLASYALNLNQLTSLSRAIDQLRKQDASFSPLVPFSLGVVSNSTTSFIVPALQSSAARFGIDLTVHEAPYGQAMQVAMGQVDSFQGLSLNAILVAIDYRGLPIHGETLEYGKASDAIDNSVGYLKLLANQLGQAFAVPCILQTLPRQPESLFGSFESRVSNTSRFVIDGVNQGIAEFVAETDHLLLDIAALAETVGSAEWFDPKLYNMAKLAFSQELIPLYADHVCRVVAATQGKSRRGLILDLDNTLWGGVIGDDGLNGIVLGQGNPLGEAFVEIQKTALALRDRGVVLAVSSKNEDTIARQPFREHPDMLLKEDHIAVFQANWNDKASNIRAIAKELSLGLDAFVFLDDNPVERDLVRTHIPELAVPELPSDPALYPRTLLAAGYFEAIHFSDEDKSRVEDYQANAKRVALQEQTGDIDAYLNSLNMRAKVQQFDDDGLKRIVQLISKSNQFNLTTRRHNEARIREIMQSPEHIGLQIRLSDTFGDNGMVSVLIVDKQADTWDIETWIMSCRVLKRRLEEFTLQHILAQAKDAGVTKVTGTYIPTERNIIVASHYEGLGFSKTCESEDGTTHWEYDVAQFQEASLPITLAD